MRFLIDTCTIKWAYIRRGKLTRRVRYRLTRSAGSVYIAEISLLELASALAVEVREHRMKIPEFSRANTQFFRDIAERRIIVLPFLSGELIQCRNLLISAGVRSGRSIKTQDAMVIHSARRLALETGSTVKFLTSDRKLSNLAITDPFGGLLDTEFWEP